MGDGDRVLLVQAQQHFRPRIAEAVDQALVQAAEPGAWETVTWSRPMSRSTSAMVSLFQNVPSKPGGTAGPGASMVEMRLAVGACTVRRLHSLSSRPDPVAHLAMCSDLIARLPRSFDYFSIGEPSADRSVKSKYLIDHFEYRKNRAAAATRQAHERRTELAAIRSFVAVAEEGQFRRAAERVGLSQPALSAQLRELEEFLGAPCSAAPRAACI